VAGEKYFSGRLVGSIVILVKCQNAKFDLSAQNIFVSLQSEK
jgi:hypothetical protein